MPVGPDGADRVYDISQGLVDKVSPINLGEGSASELQGFNLNRMSAEERNGARKLNFRSPRVGAVRFAPYVRRSSCETMTRWWDGYLWAPTRPEWSAEPAAIEAHLRIEDMPFYPESATVGVTPKYAGLSGRYQSVTGSRRTGGEHQFMPVVSRGAREIERPWWSLGYGVVRPEGLRDAGAAAGEPDRICPVFYWWDESQTRLRVAAADFTLIPTKDYHVALVLGGSWYVNGVAVSAQSGVGLSAIPSSLTLSQAPVYFGRCFTREPGIVYSATTGFTRKYTYMGKWSCTVTSVTATLIRIQNQQLAFTGAGANAYVGYRIRATNGPQAGRVYHITANANPTNDATIEFTVGAHGITGGNIVDVVPAVEPIAVDTTVQDVRFWETAPSAATIAIMARKQLFSDLRSERADANPLFASDFGAGDPKNLLAYWPLNDDGGTTCREMIRGADAVFAPEALAIVTEASVSSSGRAILLDGETQGVALSFVNNPNLGAHLVDNLGRQNVADNHYNICARMQFMMAGSMEPQTGGSISTGLYQALLSYGEKGASTPVFEARIFNNAGTHQIYFALPDGTFSAALAAFTVVPGRWYNAIVGIEALTAASQQHHVYVQIMDADQGTAGDIVAIASLGRIQADTTKQNVFIFGASVAGSDTVGSQRANHALVAFGCLGVGFHPIHTSAAVTLSAIQENVSFNRITERVECTPSLVGPEGGLALTLNSPTSLVSTSENLSSALRRWPVEVQHVDVVLKRTGEADRFIPKQNVISSISGKTITFTRVHSLPSVAGAEGRAVLWTSYTNLETFDPASDTDLNSGRDASSIFALTESVFRDLMNDVDGLQILIDPTYEFVSPLRLMPRWSRGIVLKLDAEVRGIHEYARGREALSLAAVVGGTLFDIDTRWRQDHPFLDAGYSMLIRRPSNEDRIVFAESKSFAKLYSPVSCSCPSEGIVVRTGSTVLYASNTADFYGWEIQFKLDGIDGRRTLFSSSKISHGAVAGVTRWMVDKPLHVYLADGYLVFEARDEVLGQTARWRSASPVRIEPDRWSTVYVELEADNVPVDTFIGVRFWVDGIEVPTTTIGGTFRIASPATTTNFMIGAVGGIEDGGMVFCDSLGGLIGGFAFSPQQLHGGANYTPTIIGDGDAFVVLSFQEGVGPYLMDPSGEAAAYFSGEEMIHVGSGMGDSDGGQVAMAVFNDVLYITTGVDRVWRWDYEEFTSAGLREPAGKLKSVVVTRYPARIASHGCDLPTAPGRAGLSDLRTAAPHIRTWAPASPVPSAAELGCLVYVPSDPDMGGGLWPCGYIGLVSAVATSGTPGYTLTPAPFTEHNIVTADCAWSLFRKARVLSPANYSFLVALGLLESTSPWGEARLLCDGKDNSSVPTDEALAEGKTNGGCVQFRGNFYVEAPPFRADGIPVARGKVLNVKGYIRVDTIDTFGDDKQVIVEQAIDSDSGSFRLSILDGGRLEFEFFDVLLGKFRSIRTVGRVISPRQWFYVQLRYRYKGAGSHTHDVIGGWEPDLRWLRKAGGTSIQKTRDFRDGIWVYACEGLHRKSAGYQHEEPSANYSGDIDDGMPCLLLTLPGCEAQVGGVLTHGNVATHNHSQHLLNTGLLKVAPYLTPEDGDSLFPVAGVNASSPRNGITVTLAVNTIGSLIGNPPGPAANCQITLPAGFTLPRTCSMNRDDAWNREAHAPGGLVMEEASQIFQKTAGTVRRNFWNDTHVVANTDVRATPNLGVYGILGGASSYGVQEAWAVLLRVWTMVTTGGGSGGVGAFPDGASAGVPRVFAVVHLSATDIGAASRAGVSGHQIFITDDIIFGGDGLGSLKVGAVACAATSTWHTTIELMNGTNQSPASPNRLVTPSLLEHGDNPVGRDDAPDQTDAPIRFGGTLRQGEPGAVRSGLRGRLDDWGILIAALNSSAANIYTTDCLPPDAFFTGPKDTRFQSLPRLNFVNNAAILDDASGAPATRATVTYRFDSLSGTQFTKDTTAVGGNTPSANEAPNAYVQKQGESLQGRGTHRLRITYFDPRTTVESNPGQETVVVVDGKDGAGDFLEADTSFQLLGLPVSGDRRRRVYRRVYKTDADAALLLRLAEIRDNTTAAFSPRLDNAKLAAAPTIDFANGRPPICTAIAASERNMFYGGLDDAPNVVAISRADNPDQVDGLQQVFAESGRGSGIVGLAHLHGVILVFKRQGLFVMRPAGDTFVIRRVGQNVGSLSHNSIVDLDGTLFFPSEEGVYVYAGNEQAWPASDVIEELYRKRLNLRAMIRSHGAAYLGRSQYMLSVVRATDREPRLILMAERRQDQFGNPYQVWTTLDLGIVIGSMCDFRERALQSTKVAIGSRQGAFLHDSGSLVGQWDDSPFFDDNVGEVASGSGTYTVMYNPFGSGEFNILKEGVHGVPLLIVQELDETGASVTAGFGVDYIVRKATEILYVDPADAPPIKFYVRDRDAYGTFIGAVMVIGGTEFLFRSKWFAMDVNEKSKRWEYLDLVFDAVANAAVFLDIYQDLGTAAVFKARIPLDAGVFSVPIGEINAKHLQFRVRGYGSRIGFVLHRAILRGAPDDVGVREA